MRNKKFISVLTLSLMSGSLAFAANADFTKMDANVDGKLSFDEIKMMHPDWTMEAFKLFDTDGDTALNEEEHAKVASMQTAPSTTGNMAQTTTGTGATSNDTMATGSVNKTGPATYLDAVGSSDVLASKLIGMRIYAVNSDIDESKTYPADTRKDWADVGEVNDVVLDLNGGIRGVVLGVGGFLGIGEKDVAVEMSSLRKVRESADSNDWFLVVNTTKELLTQAPAYARNTKS
jgi:PRC-barrel domain